MVITLDKYKKPLGWCKPERAAGLIKNGRAVLYKEFPAVLILKDADVRKKEIVHNYRIKIDPGSVKTGITVVEFDKSGEGTVILYNELEHRGNEVVQGLQTRSETRRNRRNRETGYRHCKFKNGKYTFGREDGWLPPSQRSIADNIINFVNKLIRWLGSCDVTVESVRFDTQKMQNPEIEGKEYQQGTLQGYDIRNYLIEKYQHTCQYCGGASNDHRLEWEHKIPKSKGGSDSVLNATLACHTCNQKKDNKTPEEWLNILKNKKKNTKLEKAQIAGLEKVIAGKTNNFNLRYATWANSSRWYLVNHLRATKGVKSLELTTGSQTAFNRAEKNYPKDHHIDALVMGNHNPKGHYRYENQPILCIKAKGRGNRLIGNINSCGIITVKYKTNRKEEYGFRTGDIVRADIPKGDYKGQYKGRIAIRHKPSFKLKVFNDKKGFDVHPKYLKLIQRNDGYTYRYEKRVAIPRSIEIVRPLA